MFTIKSKYDILRIVNTAKEEKEDKMKRTHTILATITLISVILTSACTANTSTTSSVPETAVTTTAPAVTGTVMDRIDEPKAETTTAQTTAVTTAVTTKPQETKKAETTAAATAAVTTAKPKPTTTVATTKPAPEWTETKASGTKYVNTDCYSRKKAVLGADTVKLYSVNDKVTVTAKTDTGYYKLDTGAYIHSDYLSDSKIVIQTTTTAKKAETPKPSQTTTKKQEGKPKSIYEYPFDLEAIKKVIVDDAVNNYGLINDDDPSWVPEGSSWFTPLVICCDLHPNVVKRDVESFAKDNIKGFMKKGDYFKIYIRDISEDMDIRDENGKLTKAYAIYFLRSQAGDDGNPEYP